MKYTGGMAFEGEKEIKVINVFPSIGQPITFLHALTILLIGLKLTDHIQDWNWPWVLSPVWVPLFAHWIGNLAFYIFASYYSEQSQKDK